MTTSTGPTSPPARRPRRRNCAPPTRAWPTPWSPSSPTTPDAFTPPSGGCSLNGATRWASAPCWRNPSPWSATWPPAPTPAPASPHAARHQRHYQGARVGEARIAVSGPRCACRFKGMGPAPFEALAPGRRPHRRQPRKRGRGFETAEQPPSAPVSTWPWWLSVLSDVRLRRSEAASLTLWRRAALGRRQRPHHRHPLRPTWRPRAPQSPSPLPPWRRSPLSGRRALMVGKRCSGCWSPRSPGG